MQSRIPVVIAAAICLAMAVSAFAQDPLSGTWMGDWGPNARDRNPVIVVLKYDGKTLTGTINPDTDRVQLQKATFDARTGAVHMEAMTPGRGGDTYHYVIDGKLEKATMMGTWNHESFKGDFKIAKQ